MYDEKSQELLLSVLASDSYCLGSHWVYDGDELRGLKIDWEGLNKPSVQWHKGKTKGDFTHYGDQIVILNNFLKDKTAFDIKDYMAFWREEMRVFKGYVDGSIKDTIKNMDDNMRVPCGSSSGDMSVIGRMTPLLKVSSSKDKFLENTKLFAQATHNNKDILEAMDFFSHLLLEVLEGADILESILKLRDNYSQNIQNFIQLGISSKNEDTFLTISKFGSACSLKSGFPSVIHLLFKYDNYKEALIQNAKAGGDSSSRAMIIAYLLTAKNSINIIPKQWLEFNTIPH